MCRRTIAFVTRSNLEEPISDQGVGRASVWAGKVLIEEFNRLTPRGGHSWRTPNWGRSDWCPHHGHPHWRPQRGCPNPRRPNRSPNMRGNRRPDSGGSCWWTGGPQQDPREVALGRSDVKACHLILMALFRAKTGHQRPPAGRGRRRPQTKATTVPRPKSGRLPQLTEQMNDYLNTL